MEKINALIEKLQELKNSGADLTTISYYTQLLQAEVLHERSRQHQQKAQSVQGNIAVIMPVQQPAAIAVAEPAATAAQTTTLTPNNPLPVTTVADTKREEEDINTRAARLNNQPEVNTVIVPEDINSRAAKAAAQPAPVAPPRPEPVVTSQPVPVPVTTAPPPPVEKPMPAPAATLFDSLPVAKQTPASARQEPAPIRKELNELVENSSISLNDRLRQQQMEVAQKLGDMPVKDLRQAIGINDKYQFIQELFRGDTDLYERSIKTINEFGSLQEADYWIQREIKIIQGWQDDHHLVQQFYLLLRKRFS
ncbi:hypothetical protein [Chitinophaga sp. 212800010-3]|uniref:hypothetical protein n=1 Tax=unclassified Chitinophaga TaxID=2619133 RepID=UPI002DEBDE30|nr:Transporter [Chitinophaga sp. 212800010-3]